MKRHAERLVVMAMFAALAGCATSSTPGTWGAPCSATTPCPGGLACITAATFPGGYCALECPSGSCAEGAVCDSSSSPPLCLRACSTAAECRSGYQCWQGACRPGCDVAPSSCGEGAVCEGAQCRAAECADDTACPAGERCEGRLCVEGARPPDAGPAGGPPGTPCTADAECADGLCLPATRGGVCSVPCARQDDCFAAVDFEAACAPVPREGVLRTACIPDDGSGAGPAVACASDGDCGSATCVAGQCTEACATDGDCFPGQMCRSLAWGAGTFTGCGYADGAGTQEVDLGSFDVAAGGLTPSLEIATPSDTVSLMLRARTVSGDSLPLMFYELTEPDGTVTFSLEELYALRDPPIRWIPQDTEEATALLDPNSTPDRVRFQPGLHAFRVGTFSESPMDARRARVQVTALVKRVPGGGVSAGTLDLHVFLVGVGVSAAEAPRNARLTATLSRFGTLLGAAGIRVGDVAFTEVTGADATRYQVVNGVSGPDSELAGLFRLSATAPTGALCLFFVRSLEGGAAAFSLLGVAGGIPGPSGLTGTSHSGVVLAFDPGVVGPDGTIPGTVLAHETGHFLGLFHTTEQAPPCAAGAPPVDCAPFGATDVIADTTYGDTTNLMHWALQEGGANSRVSTGQAFVLLRNPLVR